MHEKYLEFDFETTGIGKDSKNGYRPYNQSQCPLPRPNFPVELSYTVVDSLGNVLESVDSMLIRGAERLDPFVLEHCPHLSVKACERDGVDFLEALRALALASEGCTLVAHNIKYDWDEVIVATAREQGVAENVDFRKLQACPRFCTCINPSTKADKSAYYFKKLGKWIGPKLQALAAKHHVKYDPASAHKASYDVSVTLACLLAMKI